MKFRILRIFRRKTSKTNSTGNMNNLSATGLLEEAADKGNGVATGDGLSVGSYDEESKPEN